MTKNKCPVCGKPFELKLLLSKLGEFDKQTPISKYNNLCRQKVKNKSGPGPMNGASTANAHKYYGYFHK